MIAISKQTTLNIILFIVVGILLLLLNLGTCNKPITVYDSHKADSIAIKAATDLKESARKTDSIAKIADYWHLKYDTIWQSIKIGWAEIGKRDEKIKILLDSNKYFQKVNDTLSQLVTCGQIMDQVDMLLGMLNTAKSQLDSVHQAGDSTIKQQLTEIAQLKIALAQLQSEFTFLKLDYDALVKSNKKTVNRLKLEDIIAKVGVIAAAILSITAIIKH